MTSVDADTGNGEVTIKLPPETYPIISGITELSNILNFQFSSLPVKQWDR